MLLRNAMRNDLGRATLKRSLRTSGQCRCKFGGSGTDWGYGIAVDGSGNIYVIGYSNATWGSPVRAYTAGNDAFVAKA